MPEVHQGPGDDQAVEAVQYAADLVTVAFGKQHGPSGENSCVGIIPGDPYL